MIPKKIHYIWLGRGPKNERITHCIESWKKYLPDYEIKEWNEDNLPAELASFYTQSYNNKKWAFASDIARLYPLYEEGGIYMDTDVEVYQSLDRFLNDKMFMGFETNHYLSTGIIGSESHHPVIGMILNYYKSIDFKLYEDWRDYIKYEKTSPCIYTNLISLLGLDRDKVEEQHLKDLNIYPDTYFHTINEGYTYHSWNGSW